MKPFGLSTHALALELHVPANRMTAIIRNKSPRAVTADTAASPLPASPTTMMPSAASRMTQNPERTSSWSSTTTTLIGAGAAAAVIATAAAR